MSNRVKNAARGSGIDAKLHVLNAQMGAYLKMSQKRHASLAAIMIENQFHLLFCHWETKQV